MGCLPPPFAAAPPLFSLVLFFSPFRNSLSLKKHSFYPAHLDSSFPCADAHAFTPRLLLFFTRTTEFHVARAHWDV
ncbi:hypothetical protein C8J57DRAFT_1275968 [Mycena rebaudengoi]|nr:hypothetical protein C8J57DRAFT_1275968 [Mycena rebaudengoi]